MQKSNMEEGREGRLPTLVIDSETTSKRTSRTGEKRASWREKKEKEESQHKYIALKSLFGTIGS